MRTLETLVRLSTRHHWRNALVSAYIVLMAMMLPGPAQADENPQPADGGGSFSEVLRIEHDDRSRTLLQTGQAVRKIFFMEIYVMAHYLEAEDFNEGESIYNAILESPGIKQVTMVFSRALRADQIQESLRSGLEENSSEESYQEMQPDIEAFMSAINDDVNEGDEFALRWHPDGSLESFFQGDSIISIRNNDLARTMWAMWFGERSVVDRSKLVERMLTTS